MGEIRPCVYIEPLLQSATATHVEAERGEDSCAAHTNEQERSEINALGVSESFDTSGILRRKDKKPTINEFFEQASFGHTSTEVTDIRRCQTDDAPGIRAKFVRIHKSPHFDI